MYAWSSSSTVVVGRLAAQGAYAPGASREKAPKKGAVIFVTQNIQKFYELC